ALQLTPLSLTRPSSAPGAASLALAVLRPEYRPAPPAALGLALLLLFAKANVGIDPYAPDAAIGIGLLFGGGGLALALWRPRLLRSEEHTSELQSRSDLV